MLGVDVSPTDDFFGLGGHSLMAMRLLPRVSDRLGWHILLCDLYQDSTPRDLYNAQASDADGSTESKWPSYMEVHSAKSNCRVTVVLITASGVKDAFLRDWRHCWTIIST